MNQLELNLEPTHCCICDQPLAVMAFNKDWIHGNNPNTSDTHYPEGSKCCDLCNQEVVAERLSRWRHPSSHPEYQKLKKDVGRD